MAASYLALIGRAVKLRTLAIALMAAILAACTQASVGTVSGRSGQIGIHDSAVRYAAADGTVPLVIRGNPFVSSQEEAANAIAEVLRLPPGWPRAGFAATPKAESGAGVRLVLVFNARDRNLELRTLCQNLDAIELGGRGETVVIGAAFCVGQQMSAGAVGSGAAPEAMDPEFRSLLDRMLAVVFRLRSLRSSGAIP